jgi:hypothetical protein
LPTYNNEQVGMMWVHFHTKMVYDGLKSMFPDEVPVTLARSGWTGTQRYIDPFYFFNRFVLLHKIMRALVVFFVFSHTKCSTHSP